MVSNPYAAVNVNDAGTGTWHANNTNMFPKMWYIRDYDAGASETLNSIKERQGVEFFIMKPNKEYTIALKPMVAVQTYKTSTTTGYGPKRMWLDIANGPTVPHYGLRALVSYPLTPILSLR